LPGHSWMNDSPFFQKSSYPGSSCTSASCIISAKLIILSWSCEFVRWQSIFDAARTVAEASNNGSRNRWVTLSLILKRNYYSEYRWNINTFVFYSLLMIHFLFLLKLQWVMSIVNKYEQVKASMHYVNDHLSFSYHQLNSFDVFVL